MTWIASHPWRTGLAAAAVLSLTVPALAAQGEPSLTLDSVNQARFTPDMASHVNETGTQSPVMLKVQVLLDRAHVSPGVIDAYAGENTTRALKAYEQIHGLSVDGQLDQSDWQALNRDRKPVLTRYKITQDDVGGPFIDKIPDSLEAMAKLDRVAYTSPAELLAEKFHMDIELLHTLNPDADFGKAGSTITVAAVRNNKPQGKVARIDADKQREAVIAFDSDDNVIAYYPATVGSKSLPSPSGTVDVRAVAPDPKYYYTPELDFKGVPDHQIVVPPGPNNPVGVVWIDLDKENYGLHGTPDPAEIGKEASHGCVRMTNWDARELSQMVDPGIPVHFTKQSEPLAQHRTTSSETKSSDTNK